WNDGDVPYTNENLTCARRAVDNFYANLGGTNILEPLKYVFDKQKKAMKRNTKCEVQTVAFLLTDGAVSNTDAVIDLIKKTVDSKNESWKVFSCGIGGGVSRELVERMAVAG